MIRDSYRSLLTFPALSFKWMRWIAEFHWTKVCQKVFEELCHQLTTDSVFDTLQLPSLTQNASDRLGRRLGVMLSQIGGNDGREHLIEYASRLLSKGNAIIVFAFIFITHTAWVDNFYSNLTMDHLLDCRISRNRRDSWHNDWRNCSSISSIDQPLPRHSSADLMSGALCPQYGRVSHVRV